MTKEEIEELQKHDKLLKELRCHCGGFQVEDRNCWAGYIQYVCTNCGQVESYEDKSDRAFIAMGANPLTLALVRVIMKGGKL